MARDIDARAFVLTRLQAAVGADGRLPPERKVAAELGISRTEVRKALAVMESAGRIERHVGRGTFLRKIDDAADGLRDIKKRTGPREAMEARLLIEPELAGLAAINATADQISDLRDLARDMRDVPDWSAYERLDAQFHRAIAECSGNRLLLAVHEIVNEVRRAVVWNWLDTRPAGPPAGYSSFAEHEAIVAAIERRDRSGAADAMRRHLRTTTDKLIGAE